MLTRLAPVALAAVLATAGLAPATASASAGASARTTASATDGTAIRAVVPRMVALADHEDRVITLTNRKRAAHGCGPLRLDRDLRQAARRHSYEMGKAHRLSHQVAGEASLPRRVTQAGYTGWRELAENIAEGFSSPSDVVRAWMSSPTHRRNILDCGLRHLGVGAVKYGGRMWWTQDFGRK